MSYAKISSQTLLKFPYTMNDLYSENPYTNFESKELPELYKNTEDAVANNAEIVDVVIQQQPAYDAKIEKLVLSEPVLINNVWTQQWSVVAASASEIASIQAQQEQSVRATRQTKLAESDWTQLPDTPADKALWATYRQELRDVTSQAGFPWDVQWPVAPA